jgi:hypothetical protein
LLVPPGRRVFKPPVAAGWVCAPGMVPGESLGRVRVHGVL